MWNFLGIFKNQKLIQEDTVQLLETLASCLCLYFMLVFALHFPQYNRREVKLTFYTTFVGGMGYLILLEALSVPFIDGYYPLESKFLQGITVFLTRAFTILTLLSFMVVVFYKLTRSVNRLKKILFRSLFYFFSLTAFLIIFNYYLYDRYTFFAAGVSLFFVDIVFILITLLALIQFQFISFYPGIFSIFLHGEMPRMVLQKIASSNLEGSTYLKEELWRLYESEGWSDFLKDFWFGIVIDETLDNAIEHGGRRIGDEIIVQVFETGKFIDIYIYDSGKGFDPELLPDPSLPERKAVPTGRGIYIMKKFFQVDWNFLGNEVRVRVSRKPEDNPGVE
jgi:hypothetical protein